MRRAAARTAPPPPRSAARNHRSGSSAAHRGRCPPMHGSRETFVIDVSWTITATTAATQESVPGRTQVDVGELRGVGDPRIDHDQPRRIACDLAEHHPARGEALRHPRILPNEHRTSACAKITAGVTAVQGGSPTFRQSSPAPAHWNGSVTRAPHTCAAVHPATDRPARRRRSRRFRPRRRCGPPPLNPAATSRFDGCSNHLLEGSVRRGGVAERSDVGPLLW